jgi:hypothetical protein
LLSPDTDVLVVCVVVFKAEGVAAAFVSFSTDAADDVATRIGVYKTH